MSFLKTNLKFRFLFLVLCCLSLYSLNTSCLAAQAEKNFLNWSRLPDLPAGHEQAVQPGLGGAFVGVHNDALIVGGGANFPGSMPREGGKKVWRDTIYVMLKDGDSYKWLNKTFKLPRPLAYGASVSTKEGIICIGGCDSERAYSECFLMKWNSESQEVFFEQLPALPKPLAFMTAAMIKNKLFVAGGQETVYNAEATNNFFSLNFDRRGTELFSWEAMPSWPGPSRIFSVSACQSDGTHDCFYLFSGRNIHPEKPTTILTDAYKFDIIQQKWYQLSEIVPHGQSSSVCIMAGTAWSSGANHIIILGGDNEQEKYLNLERLTREAVLAKQGKQNEQYSVLAKELNRANAEHTGFSTAIYAYHTITDTWSPAGKFPSDGPVTATAVYSSDSKGKYVILPTGEIRPGIRTPAVWLGRINPGASIRMIDYVTIGAYLVVLISVGLYFSRKTHSTNEFFKAGQRIPWWAAAISVYASLLSAISVMSGPAKTFATDWRYYQVVFAIVAAAPIIVHVFLPFFRKLNVTTAYEYLEFRFNLAVRLISSVLYMLMQLSRIAIVIYLPAIALSVGSGLNINMSILIMGGVCIFYTFIGGMEAVIWTAVLKVVVLLSGVIACLVVIPMHIPGGWNGMIDIANSARKFDFVDFRFNMVDATFFALFFGAFGANIVTYGANQTVIQRYLTTATEKEAARSIWLSTAMTIPSTILTFCIGSALFSFYKVHPQELNPVMAQTDAILPYFIVTQLPAGLAGLAISAIFAASMSSVDSGLNSVATAITIDFYKRLNQSATEKSALVVARVSTLVVGLIGILLAWMMSQWSIASLWDEFSALLGMFGGGLGGIFLLGMWTKRTSSAAVLIALFLSAVFQYWVKENTNTNVWLYSLCGTIACYVFGCVFSLILPERREKQLASPIQ